MRNGGEGSARRYGRGIIEAVKIESKNAWARLACALVGLSIYCRAFRNSPQFANKIRNFTPRRHGVINFKRGEKQEFFYV